MQDIIPLFSRDADTRRAAERLRELADRLERGDVSHVVVLSQARDGHPKALLSLDPSVPLVGLVGSLELTKVDLIGQALDSAHAAADLEVATG